MVLLGGAHRGQESILNHLDDTTVRLFDPHWMVADPKDNRAPQMAGILKGRFPTLQPQPLQMKAQDALPYCDEHDSLVLAMDTITDTRETLAARHPGQRGIWQITGRGPGAGPLIALQGTLCPGDQETDRAVSLLLPTLEGMSRAASSRQLTGPDPLTAAVLTPLRQAASRQTARHLAEKEREAWDLSGGPLSVIFGQTVYPLITVHGGVQEKHSQRTALALESAGSVPAAHLLERGPGRYAVVAVVFPETRAIHFVKVAQNPTGKRSIAGVTSFVSPRVHQHSQSALFTD
jgi:hypothetical protein